MNAKRIAMAVCCLAVLSGCVDESTLTERVGKGTSMEVQHEDDRVLLEDAVADFKRTALTVAGHGAAHFLTGAPGDSDWPPEDYYPQPHCYITTRLCQMRAAGWADMDFDTLAAVCGASATFGHDPGDFAPKYVFHRFGPDEGLAEATGFASEWVRCTGVGGAWKLVKESIDTGRPLAGWSGELMLIAGYRDAGSRKGRKVFAVKDGNGCFAEWWDWEQFAEFARGNKNLTRFANRVTPKGPRDVALRVIRGLVARSEGVPEHVQAAMPAAKFGLAAIKQYADGCADLEKNETYGMCHWINPQWTVRNSSSVYLRGVAEASLFPGTANDCIRRASEQYRSAFLAWREARTLLEGPDAPEDAGKDPSRRAAAAAALQKAYESERAAIAELRKALGAVGEDE
jgi:hypothetical protein